MPAPFLAITWPVPSAEGGDAAARIGGLLAEAGWAARLSRPGLCVWGAPGRRAPVTVDGGTDAVIVGRRFDGSGPGRSAGAVGADTVIGRAQTLCSGGWGSYVALLHDPGADRWWVLRDPSGAVEVFTWDLEAVQIA